VFDSLATIVGTPVEIEILKDRPGRRRTVRGRGPRGSVIAKWYGSDRAELVAGRIAALGAGPPEPVVPRVILLDRGQHVVVLSDLAGEPLRRSVIDGDLPTCRRVGAVLADWHRAWSGIEPMPLVCHTAERECEILEQRSAGTSAAIASAVAQRLPSLAAPWRCSTVVHRDLYDEQILIGERVALIDVDDAALGPPELDIGNLVAHLELLALRHGLDLSPSIEAVLAGYAGAGGALEPGLIELCRALALLRLACLNDDRRLVELAMIERVAA
jgi:Ser/Thr protein kinase RdoA (MazF antagonist)